MEKEMLKEIHKNFCRKYSHHKEVPDYGSRYVNVPKSVHGIRQREQCAMSKARDGYGSLFEAIIPIKAGTPLSRAN